MTIRSTSRWWLSTARARAYSQLVRPSGLLGESDGLADTDHVCWVFDDPLSFADAARRYLAEGLDRHERLLCVGAGLAEDFRAAGEPFGSLDALTARGALGFADLGSAYAADAVVRPEVQRAFYEAAVAQARDDGYRGLRVVADVTPLARTPGGRAQLLRWEHLADEFIASGAGLVALCGYSGSTLDEDALADLAAVHPHVRAARHSPSFRIWFDRDRVVLAGVVDTFGADRLARVLAASPVSGPAATLDLTSLELADAAGCRVLARWGCDLAGRGTALRITGEPAIVRRVWQLVGLADLSPVTFVEHP